MAENIQLFVCWLIMSSVNAASNLKTHCAVPPLRLTVDHILKSQFDRRLAVHMSYHFLSVQNDKVNFLYAN